MIEEAKNRIGSACAAKSVSVKENSNHKNKGNKRKLSSKKYGRMKKEHLIRVIPESETDSPSEPKDRNANDMNGIDNYLNATITGDASSLASLESSNGSKQIKVEDKRNSTRSTSLPRLGLPRKKARITTNGQKFRPIEPHHNNGAFPDDGYSSDGNDDYASNDYDNGVSNSFDDRLEPQEFDEEGNNPTTNPEEKILDEVSNCGCNGSNDAVELEGGLGLDDNHSPTPQNTSLKSDNEVVAKTSRAENWNDDALHNENVTSVTKATSSNPEESENGLHCSSSDGKNNNNELKDEKDDGFFESGDELSADDDVDNPDIDINQYYESRITCDKLNMAIQGFRREAMGMSKDEDGNDETQKNSSMFQRECNPFDPNEVEYNGTTFAKKNCYMLKDQGVIVGIRHFVSDDSAECVLVDKFENTILGMEDSGIPYKANYMLGTYVQVHRCIETLHLSKLGNESDGVKKIPRMIYQPQTPGDWYTFGYFYDPNKIRKLSSRQGRIRTLEVFAGAGGSLLGYMKYGFETVLAIENDQNAVQTLKANNPELKVYDDCITKFLEFFHVLTAALGPIDHVSKLESNLDFRDASVWFIVPYAIFLLILDSFQLSMSRFLGREQVSTNWRKTRTS